MTIQKLGLGTLNYSATAINIYRQDAKIAKQNNVCAPLRLGGLASWRPWRSLLFPFFLFCRYNDPRLRASLKYLRTGPVSGIGWAPGGVAPFER